jgi:hypothetical protein
MIKLRKVLAISTIGLLILSGVYFSIIWSNKRYFDNTLKVLLNEKLGIKYELVDSKYFDIFGFDSSASYWLQQDDYSTNKEIAILQTSQITWPDEVDIRRKSIKSDFEFQDLLAEYSLYELELPLKGTVVCEGESACNYFIFRSIGNKNLFVDIVKF